MGVGEGEGAVSGLEAVMGYGEEEGEETAETTDKNQ